MKKTLSSFLEKKTTEQISLALAFLAPVLFYFIRQNSLVLILFLFSMFLLIKTPLPKMVQAVIFAVDLLLIIPLVGIENTYYLDVITQVGIYAVLAMGLNIVVGFTGLLNLGYVAFYAVGAYTYAIFASEQANNFIPWIHFPLSGDWFWAFLVLSFVVSGLVGFLLGLLVLRLRGDYLAVVTLGFAEIIRLLFNNLDKPINFTNGPKGIGPIQPPSLFGMAFSQPQHYYFLVLCLFGLTLYAVHVINQSRIGRAWVAIREDEIAARTVGIPVVRMKLLAFCIGAAFAGMMGAVFAAKQTYIDPTSFGFMESIGILAMVIMGGLGNVRGVILGATAVLMLQLQLLKEFSAFLTELSSQGILHFSNQLDPAKYERLVFGLILILMCIYRPQGFLPAKRVLHRYKEKLFKKKASKDKGGQA